MTLSTALPPAAADLLSTITATRPAPDEITARRTSATALAAALAANSAAWADLVEYRPDRRWSSVLDHATAAAALDPALHADLVGAQVELFSWLPGQATALHDHGGAAGAFAVVHGALTELTVTETAAGGVHDEEVLLTAGRVRPFAPHHVHQVTNVGVLPAVSVHVHTPRPTVVHTYRIAACGLLRTGTEQLG
ncbi:cysteine dioxygenase [Trujillonella endophytica]|uniref:Cysteine dioxygenase type I n=1 Tax=Trujillonella endophytica TaxID=673521 RepID=A0A1H8PU46_9ACTN|nr:cysteine dioxygenase family protein [Trujillella endophytica]SEO45445.1 Cysteine dioxygenase type I [Trujillella endophytica]